MKIIIISHYKHSYEIYPILLYIEPHLFYIYNKGNEYYFKFA